MGHTAQGCACRGNEAHLRHKMTNEREWEHNEKREKLDNVNGKRPCHEGMSRRTQLDRTLKRTNRQTSENKKRAYKQIAQTGEALNISTGTSIHSGNVSEDEGER